MHSWNVKVNHKYYQNYLVALLFDPSVILPHNIFNVCIPVFHSTLCALRSETHTQLPLHRQGEFTEAEVTVYMRNTDIMQLGRRIDAFPKRVKRAKVLWKSLKLWKINTNRKIKAHGIWLGLETWCYSIPFYSAIAASSTIEHNIICTGIKHNWMWNVPYIISGMALRKH